MIKWLRESWKDVPAKGRMVWISFICFWIIAFHSHFSGSMTLYEFVHEFIHLIDRFGFHVDKTP